MRELEFLLLKYGEKRRVLDEGMIVERQQTSNEKNSQSNPHTASDAFTSETLDVSSDCGATILSRFSKGLATCHNHPTPSKPQEARKRARCHPDSYLCTFMI